MTLNSRRILLNAEPFGFGPSAAIASIAVQLQTEGFQISYVGEKHTLDLQSSINYEATYNVTDMSRTARAHLFDELAGAYDLFFTAMDFSMAESAQQAGFKTIIYDALTWYWPEIHPAIKNAELYVAQNFFGVEQRLRDDARHFPAYKVVAPLVSNMHQSTDREVVLLNMGGLQNPYWSFEDTVMYAKLIVASTRSAIPASEKVIVTTSSSIARSLHDPAVSTLSRLEMTDILSKAKYAIMTPGLGNIYDAAAFDVPTLWLPPANDSQGQQAQLLVDNDCYDELMDWSEFASPVNYKASQTKVLQSISEALQSVHEDNSDRISEIMAKKLRNLSMQRSSKTAELLRRFGSDGTTEICSAIASCIGSKKYARTK